MRTPSRATRSRRTRRCAVHPMGRRRPWLNVEGACHTDMLGSPGSARLRVRESMTCLLCNRFGSDVASPSPPAIVSRRCLTCESQLETDADSTSFRTRRGLWGWPASLSAGSRSGLVIVYLLSPPCFCYFRARSYKAAVRTGSRPGRLGSQPQLCGGKPGRRLGRPRRGPGPSGCFLKVRLQATHGMRPGPGPAGSATISRRTLTFRERAKYRALPQPRRRWEKAKQIEKKNEPKPRPAAPGRIGKP
jgi:hypothetical protein